MDEITLLKMLTLGCRVDFDPGCGTVTVSKLPKETANHALRIEDQAGFFWYGDVDGDGTALLVRRDLIEP